jgi:hypothetical protein
MQSSNLSMYLVDLSLCAHAYTRECVVHFHPFAASIEIAKGANSGKFVNALGHRPKVSLVLYKR